MKYKDPQSNQFKELYIRGIDDLPIGSEIEIPDDAQTPSGWQEVNLKLDPDYEIGDTDVKLEELSRFRTQSTDADLNTITKDGQYLLSGNNANAPITSASFLEVIAKNDNTLMQRVTVSVGTAAAYKVYERIHSVSYGWTDWIPTCGTPTILAAVNFNDIIIPGTYFEGSTPTGSNKPTGALTGWLEVFNYNGIMITQRYTNYTGDKFFIRGYYNNWSNWKTYTGS